MRRKRTRATQPTATREHEQFHHLTRLAWGLSKRGLAVSVQLPRRDEPCVAVQRVSGPLLVRASLQGERWVFSWGRGRDRCVDARDEAACERVWEVAQ
ncbi:MULTISPECIES: hypothetical protein [Nonomuraea]|uniref:Uncharacterized protein n=1 Tax=Nonomuraea ferruginea TaxID=46174 RepID=A0ABT4SPD4_9ACTN|nr:hypothetical protein [Nonomuraea ferruginea]MDA0639102.1 hypothetical protein [Nonomuraea ferruginea]